MFTTGAFNAMGPVVRLFNITFTWEHPYTLSGTVLRIDNRLSTSNSEGKGVLVEIKAPSVLNHCDREVNQEEDSDHESLSQPVHPLRYNGDAPTFAGLMAKVR